MAGITTNKVTVSGLVSGYDTDAIVTAMTSMMKLGVSEAQDQQKLAQSQLAGYQSLEANLTALKISSDRLSTASSWQLHKATSSDSTVMTATATAGASPGTYTIKVSQLAQAEQKISQGFDSADAVVGTGTVSISLGSATFSPITLTSSNNTLQGLSDAINAAGLTVKASVVNDGSETGGYHLLLTSTKTGASRTIGFTSNLTGGAVTPTFSVMQAAADAKVTVGATGTGSTPLTITSNSNAISNAVPGVTLNLLQTSSTATTVTVQDDSGSATSMINSFISNYNNAVDYIASSTAYDATTKQGGILQGDYAAVSMHNALGDLVNSQSGTGVYQYLTDIGVTLGTDGHLSISDPSALNSALQTNWDGVANLFSDSKTGLATRLSSLIDGYTSSKGLLSQKETDLKNEISDWTDTITSKQTIIDAQVTNLKNQFTAMEKALNKFQQQMSQITNLFSSSSSSSSSSSKGTTSTSSSSN